MRRRLLLAAPALLLSHRPQAAEPPLALVLALDGSGSTTRESSAWRRMTDAHHAALSHPAVVEAILRRRVRAMATAWSFGPTDVLDWRDLRTARDVARFADAVAALVPGGGSTSTAALLAAMPGWLRHAEGHRPVLDIATDGEDDFLDSDDRPEPGGNDHPRHVRDLLLRLHPDLAINGLIEGPEDGPGHRFFVRHIQGGPDSFCLVVQDDLDVARRLRQKILREMA
jgi:hypothetical protein